MSSLFSSTPAHTDHVDGSGRLGYPGQGCHLSYVCSCSGCWCARCGREAKGSQHRRQHSQPDPLQSKISCILDHTCAGFLRFGTSARPSVGVWGVHQLKLLFYPSNLPSAVRTRKERRTNRVTGRKTTRKTRYGVLPKKVTVLPSLLNAREQMERRLEAAPPTPSQYPCACC